MRTARHSRPGLDVTEHTLQVPLDHSDPSGEQIEVFARELVAAGREPDGLPWLLWLQGGPGGRADRPAAVSGWLRRALREFRVLLLDQRGTGRSTPATRQSLPVRGDAAAQAAYLA
ncbi:MAG: alpha/beta hydrolase, partial [Micromonosporaceae bacterium]